MGDTEAKIEELNLAYTFMVCGAVIQQDDKFMLVQEGPGIAHKQWNIPGGKVDSGEELQQTTVREVKEECGLDIEVGEHLFVKHDSVSSPVLHAFEAKVIGCSPVPQEGEIMDIQWFTYEEIKNNLELRDREYTLGAIESAMKK